jgi:hypothetical protein
MMRALLKGVFTALPAVLLVTAALGLNLPWAVEPDVRAALPFLVLPFVHWTAYRRPERLPAPLVLLAGLAADLAAGTPLGFWALLYLGVLASGRGMRPSPGDGLLAGLVALGVYGIVALALATLVPLAFTLEWPRAAPVLAGIGLGLVLEAIALIIARSMPAGRAPIPAGAV